VPVAYAVVIRERTRNPAQLEEYKQLLPPVFQRHPVTYLANQGRLEVLEGPRCENVILIEFPSFEAAHAWYHSAEYQAVCVHRFQGGDYRCLLTEGLAAPEPAMLAHLKAVGERSSTPDIVIRPATEADKAWAAALMASSEPWITLGRTEAAARAIMGSASHFLFVAEGPQKENHGFILLHPEGVAGSPYIRSIAVAERFRSAGVGKLLLDFAERAFAGRARQIFLCVSSFNQRAKALYERRRYAVVGELRDYVIVGASEFLMSKTLTS
jgi:uncharacterized protein (DUF1330 family)/ribosomal protein S18 acetylase RimI-like enzyme